MQRTWSLNKLRVLDSTATVYDAFGSTSELRNRSALLCTGHESYIDILEERPTPARQGASNSVLLAMDVR